MYERELAARFRQVNGDHPMSAADDAYVSAQFAVLDDLCLTSGREPDAVRLTMPAGLLPLPGYLRSDGAEMVPKDLFALADAAGGPEKPATWFVAHWADPSVGRQEWEAYLSGQYVCLQSVRPETIQRKEQLTTEITAAPHDPDAGSPEWSARLHAAIDELDALEPAFTPYDRLRFGRPTSRDLCIDAMRARFPRGTAPTSTGR
ncbi:DUF6058 family natural product biosynthesis protein [Streptomyces xantholiticus]|uniref:DUF6058 family natural product biosynthesis protein n=1 Tax=Streptomyces xantholiticus TaxID=68285 RepID=UPI001679D6E8|nr:DUF6058 family natural product biosynthesis protein [Streptomyces xantholiticus]GGW29053.1 hypothetical protein GCM10010381_12010 [Streptomyces xantholiticus]